MCYWLIFRTLLFCHLFQVDIWKVRNQLCLLLKWKAEKLVCDFKVGLARLWHGTLQREREITPHTWSTKKSLWNGLLGGIQSGTSRGIDGTAPGRWGCLAWTGRSLGLYQWALAHPLGAPKPCRLKNPRAWQHIWACDAFYFSQAWCYRLQSPAQQYQWSWPRWYSFTGKNKTASLPLPALAN